MPGALRTATPMGDWRSLKFTVSETQDYVYGIKDAVAGGVSFLYLVGDTVGAVLETASVGEEAVLIYHAEKIMVPLEDQASFDVGERVYWNPTTRNVTDTYDSGYYWIGIATEAASVGDTYVEIDLKGDHAEVEVAL